MNNKKEQLIEDMGIILDDYNVYFLDNMDDAIIGYTYIPEIDKYKICYSVSKILKILETEMSSDDALDFFGYNIECLRYCIFIYE